MSRSLMKGFVSIFSAKVATSVLSIATLPLIVRVLGPSGYGDFAFLLSVFSLLMIFISSGVTGGVQKFVAEDRDDADWEASVIWFYFKLAAVLAAVGSLALVAVTGSGFIDQLFGPDYVIYFYLLAVFVIAAQFRAFTNRTLLGLSLEQFSEPIAVLNKVLWIGIGLALGVYFSGGVAGFLLGNIIGDVVAAVLGLVIINRYVPLRTVVGTVTTKLSERQLLTFNVLNIALVLLVMSLYHIDVIMIRMFLGNDETGYYKAALALAEYMWFVPIVLQSLLLHSTSSLWSSGEHERVSRISARITRYTALLTIVMAIGIAILADRFVPYYFGPDFLPVVAPLIFLLPGALGFAIARPIYAISQGHGNLKPLIIATGGAALLNLVLNFLLIPRYGIIGAAVATSIGYGSMFVLHVLSARYIGYDPLDDFRALRIGATVLVSAPIIYLMDMLISSDVLALVVVPILGGAVYFVAAIGTGALSVDELLAILDSFPSPIRKWSKTIETWIDG
ncbi:MULTISPECIES: polysaccharide biosynthesis C-terminal domain-containing protein [Haloferax]|uniref:Oligosaccharide flippase family protein n=2 Tax=Haloferax TaxID=2251 RepID=A0A6G1Z6Y2_9EURY|nr:MULTISPECIES: polysaccharide biosynthesis C-terminal domain-containing protein [Haloferax]KAB1185125.1 oligosaccharide flippase family protein [Haloferax sp. CBA1149]MRW82302.1 oligosaccharide flippase family protein [Haloferax marinisediminis]